MACQSATFFHAKSTYAVILFCIWSSSNRQCFLEYHAWNSTQANQLLRQGCEVFASVQRLPPRCAFLKHWAHLFHIYWLLSLSLRMQLDLQSYCHCLKWFTLIGAHRSKGRLPCVLDRSTGRDRRQNLNQCGRRSCWPQRSFSNHLTPFWASPTWYRVVSRCVSCTAWSQLASFSHCSSCLWCPASSPLDFHQCLPFWHTGWNCSTSRWSVPWSHLYGSPWVQTTFLSTESAKSQQLLS